MNIFKILASGDGSINEPNVSAFLGYLINPKADHGISDELLKRILKNLYDKNNQSALKDFLVDSNKDVRNLSMHSNFEIEILLEQAFKSEHIEKKEIVDIVILCFEKNIEKKESLAKVILADNNKGDLKHIFLIENKIKDNATREGQLINQAKSSVDALKKILNKSESEIEKIISLLFVTPEGDKSALQFSEFERDSKISIPKAHVHWNSENENSIMSYLKDILKEEAEGNVEAINEYTKYTIKSFITFIQNNFKSALEEELETEVTRDIDVDMEKFISKHHAEFSDNSWDIIKSVESKLRQSYQNINIQYSRTHPISVAIKRGNEVKFGKKIFSLTKTGRDLRIQLIKRNFKTLLEKGDEVVLKYAEELGFEVRSNQDWGTDIISKNMNVESVLAIFDMQYNLAMNK
jgi:hypothetical protein